MKRRQVCAVVYVLVLTHIMMCTIHSVAKVLWNHWIPWPVGIHFCGLSISKQFIEDFIFWIYLYVHVHGITLRGLWFLIVLFVYSWIRGTHKIQENWITTHFNDSKVFYEKAWEWYGVSQGIISPACGSC